MRVTVKTSRVFFFFTFILCFKLLIISLSVIFSLYEIPLSSQLPFPTHGLNAYLIAQLMRLFPPVSCRSSPQAKGLSNHQGRSQQRPTSHQGCGSPSQLAGWRHGVPSSALLPRTVCSTNSLRLGSREAAWCGVSCSGDRLGDALWRRGREAGIGQEEKPNPGVMWAGDQLCLVEDPGQEPTAAFQLG